MSVPLLEGCSPEGSKKLMQTRLQYIPTWKEDPAKVLELIKKAAEDWALFEIDFEIASKRTTNQSQGGLRKKKSEKNQRLEDEERRKTPITCFGYGDQGHSLRPCRRGKEGGGKGGGESKGDAGAGSHDQGTGANGVSTDRTGQPSSTGASGTVPGSAVFAAGGNDGGSSVTVACGAVYPRKGAVVLAIEFLSPEADGEV